MKSSTIGPDLYNRNNHLDAQPFKVPCEKRENFEGSGVNEESGQIFQPV